MKMPTKFERNVSDLDRLARVLLAEAVIAFAYFRLGGWELLAAWLVALALLASAASGFCSLYRLTNTATYRYKRKMRPIQALPLLLAIAVLPWASGHLLIQPTTDRLQADSNRLGEFLQRSIYDADAGIQSLTAANFNEWQKGFGHFKSQYGSFRPFVIKRDRQFGDDLTMFSRQAAEIDTEIRNVQLDKAGEKMLELQAGWAQMLRRNGLPHPSQPLINLSPYVQRMFDDGQAGHAPGILMSYPSTELRVRELEMAFGSSAELAALSQRLEELTEAAQRGAAKELPDKARAFRSAYIALYR